MADEKQMSPAEREARQAMADKKAEKANESAYTKSLTSTEYAPASKPAASAPKKFAKGGYVRAADGIASKGKTRGQMR
jgi:hypothetical protein